MFPSLPQDVNIPGDAVNIFNLNVNTGNARIVLFCWR